MRKCHLTRELSTSSAVQPFTNFSQATLTDAGKQLPLHKQGWKSSGKRIRVVTLQPQPETMGTDSW